MSDQADKIAMLESKLEAVIRQNNEYRARLADYRERLEVLRAGTRLTKEAVEQYLQNLDSAWRKASHEVRSTTTGNIRTFAKWARGDLSDADLKQYRAEAKQ